MYTKTNIMAHGPNIKKSDFSTRNSQQQNVNKRAVFMNIDDEMMTR